MGTPEHELNSEELLAVFKRVLVHLDRIEVTPAEEQKVTDLKRFIQAGIGEAQSAGMIRAHS